MKTAPPSANEKVSPVWQRAARHRVRLLEEPRGTLEMFLPAPKVCLTRARGHLSLTLARHIPEVLAPIFAEGHSIALFSDWKQMTSYDSGSRRMLTNWVLANIQQLGPIEVAVGSRLVAMGVAAANVVTSVFGVPVVGHTSLEELEHSMARFL